MIFRRSLVLLASVATVLIKLNEPTDDTGRLRRQLARAIPTIEVRERPVHLWERFTAEARARPAAPIGNAAARDAIVAATLVQPGAQIEPGMMLATLQGAPIVLLAGELPSYRDLHDGDSGPDVDQFHAALGGLGIACACGRALTRREIAAFRTWVFMRSPVALDHGAWSDTIPQAGLVWADDFSVVVDKVRWHAGEPAKGPLMTTRNGSATVEVRRVPAVSRVRVGQLAVARRGAVVWRTRVGEVLPGEQGERRLRLSGDVPAGLGGRFGVKVLTLAKSGRALLVPTAAVGTSAEGVDRIVIVRDGVRRVRQVRIVADLGGRLAVRGPGLRSVEHVALPSDGA